MKLFKYFVASLFIGMPPALAEGIMGCPVQSYGS